MVGHAALSRCELVRGFEFFRLLRVLFSYRSDQRKRKTGGAVLEATFLSCRLHPRRFRRSPRGTFRGFAHRRTDESRIPLSHTRGANSESLLEKLRERSNLERPRPNVGSFERIPTGRDNVSRSTRYTRVPVLDDASRERDDYSPPFLAIETDALETRRAREASSRSAPKWPKPRKVPRSRCTKVQYRARVYEESCLYR